MPKKYEELYRQIEGQLASFSVELRGTSAAHSVLRGAVWTAAGCEPVPTLLDEARRQEALRELDALQRVGAQLVALEVCYPLLSPQFQDPRPALEHYANLANQVRLRGMKLLVRQRALARTDGSIVARRYYVRLGKQRFERERYEETKSIALALQPDYLTLVSDPVHDTAGLKLSARDWGGYLRRTTTQLRAALGDFAPVLGAGLTVSDSVELADALAAVPGLAYVELRVHRLATAQESLLSRVPAWSKRIRTIDPGKRVLIGDAWLAKAGADEPFGGEPPSAVAAREVYSFWIPLDIAFLRLLARAARAYGLDAIVVSQPRYLFTYLDFFDPATFRAKPLLLIELAQRQAVAAMAHQQLTETGRAFSAL